MQGTKNRAIASALFWVLIVCVVALYFDFIAAGDPEPTDSTAEEAGGAGALAAILTPASLRVDHNVPLGTRTRQVNGLADSPSQSQERLDGMPPDSGRRVVSLGDRGAHTRGVAPYNIATDALPSAVVKSADNGPADEASAEDRIPSNPPSSPYASQRADKVDDGNSNARDQDDGDAAGQRGDEEGNHGDYHEISGQVVDDGGRPISGIGVVAVARRLFDEGAELGFGDGATEGLTETGASGVFLFRGIANGEYEIRTVPSGYYPKVASMAVRAGVNNAKLVLADEHDVWIDGYVADPEGRPLDGVEVYLSATADPVAVSGANGLFNFAMTVRGDRGSLLTLLAEGYQDQKVNLTRNDWHDRQQVEVDITMQPTQVLTVVSGVVQSETGDPVVGEQVYLKGSQTKHKGVTDVAGRFSLDQVEVGGNYTMWMMPAGPYKKYRQDRMTVPAGGLNNLHIVLEPLGLGTVTGRMIDTDGNPAPNFTLVARSDSARGSTVQLTSDRGGYFVAEEVPDGRLRIESESFPRFVVSGIQLPPGGEVDVDLVLDVGNRQIGGRVTDDSGRPLAGADITLSWVLRENPLLHESLRKTTAGPDGGFQFTQLGTGVHTIIARAPGFETAQLDEEVDGAYGGGSNIDVQLVPLAD